MVNLELYRVFYTVAKCGSLTKAADQLFISQPAVSQAIKQLESQLGGKLFNRQSRGMQLTDPAGKKMFEIVSEIIEKLTVAENEFNEINTHTSGSVRISAADTLTTYKLMKYISEYHEMYPSVSFAFRNSTTRQSIELIKENQADIGFVNLPIEDKGVVFTGQTGIIADIFVASPKKFAHLNEKHIELDNLSNYPIIMLNTTTTTRQEIDKFLSDLSVKLVPEIEVSSVSLMIALAKEGLGIACVPKDYVAEELKTGELFQLNVTPSFPVRVTGVIVNKDRNYSQAVAEFLKLLNKYENND
ncbi:MAG: LysR family transcriptional regulator [Clostridia bacterium]|nr:LysR family transcriptional regulator [Clostridia bacterium]